MVGLWCFLNMAAFFPYLLPLLLGLTLLLPPRPNSPCILTSFTAIRNATPFTFIYKKEVAAYNIKQQQEPITTNQSQSPRSFHLSNLVVYPQANHWNSLKLRFFICNWGGPTFFTAAMGIEKNWHTWRYFTVESERPWQKTCSAFELDQNLWTGQGAIVLSNCLSSQQENGHSDHRTDS